MVYWPENVIIWGAGATAALKMPTSNQQNGIITGIKNGNFGDAANFLSEEELSLLSEFLQVVPNYQKGEISIQDTLNLCAVCLLQKRTFRFKGREFSFSDIEKCQTSLLFLITKRFQEAYKKLLKDKPEDFQKYYDMYKFLAEHEIQEKIKGLSSDQLQQRNAYLLSYAFVNFNWDFILLWAIFNVHKDMNNENKNYIGSPAVKLKIFNDFSTFLGTVPLEDTASDIWYPYNETVAQRINDPDHNSGRRILLGKFYQAHGSFNWKECPHCGKLNMWLGKEWKLLSESLFSSDELKKCLFCETEFPPKTSVRLIQTPFKGLNPPYIEEIQRDMFVALENAKHIVFAGYSLPEDDLIYRSMMAARRSSYENLKVTVLEYSEAATGEQWVSLEKANNKVANRIAYVLGIKDENIRVNLQGIPNAFLTAGQIDKNKVLDVFYWNN